MKIVKVAVLLLLIGGSLRVWAEGVDNRDEDLKILRDKLTLVETALNEKAFDRIVPLLDEDVVVVFLNGEVARGINQVRAYFEKTLSGSNPILSDYRTKASIDVPARFVDDLAIADGSTEDTFIFADGSQLVVHTLWTVTLEQEDGAWKILQLHFSSNFFDNPLVDAMKERLVRLTLLGGLAGLVLGLVVALLTRRRRRADV